MYIVLKTFFSIRSRISQSPFMKTHSLGVYIPRDYEFKWINICFGDKQTLTSGLEINSDTSCDDPLLIVYILSTLNSKDTRDFKT